MKIEELYRRKADLVKVSETEAAQKQVLLDSCMFFDSIKIPLIRNPHLELPMKFPSTDYAALIEDISQLGYSPSPAIQTVDSYYDTGSGDFEKNGINSRLRLYMNQKRDIFSVRNIATLDNDEMSPVSLEEQLFKPEIIYLNRVDDKTGIEIPEYMDWINESFSQMRLLGRIEKKSVKFDVMPWDHIISEHGGLTMSDNWVNMRVDDVTILRNDKQEIRLTMFEVENSYGGEAISTVKSIIQKLQIIRKRGKFAKERKAAFFK